MNASHVIGLMFIGFALCAAFFDCLRAPRFLPNTDAGRVGEPVSFLKALEALKALAKLFLVAVAILRQGFFPSADTWQELRDAVDRVDHP